MSSPESQTTQSHLLLEINRESIEGKAFLVLLMLNLSNSRSRIKPNTISLPLFSITEPYNYREANKWEICPVDGPSNTFIGLKNMILYYKITSDEYGAVYSQVLGGVQTTNEYVQASINLYTTEDYLTGQILLYLKLVEKLTLNEAFIKLSEFKKQ